MALRVCPFLYLLDELEKILEESAELLVFDGSVVILKEKKETRTYFFAGMAPSDDMLKASGNYPIVEGENPFDIFLAEHGRALGRIRQEARIVSYFI